MFSPSNLTDQNSDPQTPIPAASLDWSSKESISARASIVGERLALKSLESIQPLATNPLIISAGANGCAVLLRYGVVVTFNLSTIEESKLLTTLKPHIRDPLNGTASEVLAIAFRSNVNERLESEILWLQECSTERLQIVAEALGKSVVLDYYEKEISRANAHVS